MFQIGQAVTVTGSTFAVGDVVMVAPEVWERAGHIGPREGTTPQAEQGTIDRANGAGRWFVTMPDACDLDATDAELSLVAGSGSDHRPIETPVEAPSAPAEPLDVWEAGLTDSDATLAAIWQAADNAAHDAHACSEYEATVAYPHGHAGRDGYTPEDDDMMGAGYVTLERQITRTVYVTQTMNVYVEAGQDPYEAASDAYAWEDESTEDGDDGDDYDGPSITDDERDMLSMEPNEDKTQPADLVRAALEDSQTAYQGIRDAILSTARAHGAPVMQSSTVSLSASVSRHQGGTWSALAMERLEDVHVNQWQADALRDVRTFDAYEVAKRVLEQDRESARLAHGTLSAVVRSTWEVTA